MVPEADGVTVGNLSSSLQAVRQKAAITAHAIMHIYFFFICVFFCMVYLSNCTPSERMALRSALNRLMQMG